MRCPYCAEQIQENAIICRFCMASKVNGEWEAPHNRTASRVSGKGHIKFTARFAGVFFLLSVLMELAAISTPVSLFGAEYMGPIAVSYHLLFILLYLGMGIGLWTAQFWGLQVMLAGSIAYTLDKIHYLVYGDATTRLMDEYGAILGSDGGNMISGAVNLATFISLAAWWGFVGYLYYHRSYFQSK